MPRPQAPWVAPGRALAQALRAVNPSITRNAIAARLSAEIPDVPVASHTRRVILGWEEEGSLPKAAKSRMTHTDASIALAPQGKSPT